MLNGAGSAGRARAGWRPRLAAGPAPHCPPVHGPHLHVPRDAVVGRAQVDLRHGRPGGAGGGAASGRAATQPWRAALGWAGVRSAPARRRGRRRRAAPTHRVERVKALRHHLHQLRHRAGLRDLAVEVPGELHLAIIAPAAPVPCSVGHRAPAAVPAAAAAAAAAAVQPAVVRRLGRVVTHGPAGKERQRAAGLGHHASLARPRALPCGRAWASDPGQAPAAIRAALWPGGLLRAHCPPRSPARQGEGALAGWAPEAACKVRGAPGRQSSTPRAGAATPASPGRRWKPGSPLMVSWCDGLPQAPTLLTLADPLRVP